MSYCALGLGVILFLAATVISGEASTPAPASSTQKADVYKDKQTDLNVSGNPNEDVKAFASR